MRNSTISDTKVMSDGKQSSDSTEQMSMSDVEATLLRALGAVRQALAAAEGQGDDKMQKQWLRLSQRNITTLKTSKKLMADIVAFLEALALSKKNTSAANLGAIADQLADAKLPSSVTCPSSFAEVSDGSDAQSCIEMLRSNEDGLKKDAIACEEAPEPSCATSPLRNFAHVIDGVNILPACNDNRSVRIGDNVTNGVAAPSFMPVIIQGKTGGKTRPDRSAEGMNISSTSPACKIDLLRLLMLRLSGVENRFWVVILR